MLQVTIHTKLFEESIRFYEEVVGLSIMRDLRAQGREIVFLGKSQDDTFVELIKTEDAEPFTNKNFSIGFPCENVDKEHFELEFSGFTVTPVVSVNEQLCFFFVKDPNGVNVQLCGKPA